MFTRNTSSLVFRYFLLEKKLWAADNGGSAGHEINRTTLLRDIEQGLKTDIVKPVKDNSSKKYLRCIFR
jgi:hypothetical protein